MISGRAAARALAVLLCGASIAMTAYGVVSLMLPGTERIPERPSLFDGLTFAITLLAFPTIGLVVAWARPTHPMGWLFLLIAAGINASIFAAEYAGRAVYTGADHPGYELVVWIGGWMWFVAMGLAITFGPLLFPTGRLPSARWRPVAWLSGAAIGVTVAAELVRPGPIPDYEEVPIMNPVGVDPALGGPISAVADAGFVAILGLGVVSVGSLVARFRGSTGIERQQLKWFLYPMALFMVGLMVASVLQTSLAWSISILGLALVPIGAGIGILRHRLFDIDLVINRTLVYATLTVLLGGLYAGLVLGLQSLVTPLLGTDTVAVAVSTLAVAALFGPARQRVQRVVDRRFYRSRYDAQLTMEAFAVRLRDELDTEHLTETLRAASVAALRPRSASVWLRDRSS